ncbi:hypothetical protein TNCV_1151761 [Trichonephila clavipes]|nr:hypothetical protein TNCV_1151761 [Trichonephila clavipes]
MECWGAGAADEVSPLHLTAHTSGEKAAMIGFVKLQILDTYEKFQLRGKTLAKAMELVPTGSRSWFVAYYLPLRLWVRFRLMSVDFHDAENRHRLC